MKSLRIVWQASKSALLVLFCWFSIHGVALAAPAKKAAEKSSSTTGGGAYVMSYLLIVLSITLGMLFVCRSSNRHDRAHPEAYGKSKTAERTRKNSLPHVRPIIRGTREPTNSRPFGFGRFSIIKEH